MATRAARQPGDSFVGRSAELELLARTLGHDTRLLTLIGPGGAGKTRLALEHLRRSSQSDPARAIGSCVCDLTEASTQEGICTAVGQALDVPLLSADAPANEQLGHALAARGELLLVLDNFDRVVPHGPATVGVWLELAPRLQIIVTSRQRISLAQERCVEIGALSMPAEGETGYDAIAGSEAVRLFVERARRARSDYTLAPSDAPAVAAIVRRLDGLPLAIELCAARSSVLGAAQMLQLLTQRFDLLVARSTSRPPRHGSLRAAIDASWDLLEPWERHALAGCSVFRGGFAHEAVAAVLDARARPPGGGALWAVDVMQALHEKSLVVAFEPAGFPGERRYALYDSLRDYAAEKLQDLGETEAAEDRHGAYFAEMSTACAERQHGHGGGEQTRRLMLELDNIVAAHERALARRPVTRERLEMAAAAALSLEMVFVSRGPLHRLTEMLAPATTPAVPISETLEARALALHGWALVLTGRRSEGRAELEQALVLAERAGHARTAAQTAIRLGLTGVWRGDWDASSGHFERARTLLEHAGDPWLAAVLLRAEGSAFAHRGRNADAERCCREALALFAAAGSRRDEGITLGQLAARCLERGGLAEARAYVEQAVVALEGTGDRRSRGIHLGFLGAIDQEEGRFAEARAHYDEALRVQREVGQRQAEGMVHGLMGNLALETGDLLLAQEHYEAAVSILEEAGYDKYAALYLGGQAAAEAAQGMARGAAEHFDLAEATLRRVGTPTDLEVLGLLRGQLDLALAGDPKLDGETRAHHRERAKERLAPYDQPTTTPNIANDEIRFALRVLAKSLRAPASQTPVAADVLEVASDGAWFSSPGGARVELGHRPSLARLLRHLAALRVEFPNQPAPPDVLIERCWPGERIQKQAASARLRVAVSTLRKLGLGAAIRRHRGGYLIDAAVSVRVTGDIDRSS